MNSDYLLCGWRVQSDFTLPELPPWPDNGGAPSDAAPPDVTICAGTVPERLEAPVSSTGYLSVDGEGTVLLAFPGSARFLLRAGNSITVELHPQAAGEWRLFLLGSALGILCLQRGLFPLHATSLLINGHAVAIAATSGGGKSTLGLALTQRGHRLLSDDLSALQTGGCNVAPTLLPAIPRLKLWRDALEQLGIDPAPLPRVRPTLDKFIWRPGSGFDSTPRRLDAILTLAEGPELMLSRKSAVAAVPAIRHQMARHLAATYLGRQAAIFAQVATIAQTVPVYRLERPKSFQTLAATMDLIEETFAP